MIKIFIISSREKLDIANGVHAYFDYQENFESQVWTHGMSILNKTTLDALFKKTEECDFAICVFHPDDKSIIRGQEKNSVRDNIIFELGLFFGRLGKNNCFILMPRDIPLSLPTDLIGITPATYVKRSDNNVKAMLETPCNEILSVIKEKSEEITKISSSIIEEDKPCRADWLISSQEPDNLKYLEVNSDDVSDLFFLFLSVNDCERSRIIIKDKATEITDNSIKIEAMYDLMGFWDIIIKYRVSDEGEGFSFKNKIIKDLISEKIMEMEPDSHFGRRQFINVVKQSTKFNKLLDKDNREKIHYKLLSGDDEYKKYRTSRAFLYIEAKGEKCTAQRRNFINQLHNAVERDTLGAQIIESVCEGEKEIIVEIFSTCSQQMFINNLNKSIESIISTHHLQKYTLQCSYYDEEKLLLSAVPISHIIN